MPGKTSNLTAKQSYITELVAHNNLPTQIIVNQRYITPEVRKVSDILITTTDNNIWTIHSLLAAEVFKLDLQPWQYCTIIDREQNTVKMGFLLVLTHKLEENTYSNHVEAGEKNM